MNGPQLPITPKVCDNAPTPCLGCDNRRGREQKIPNCARIVRNSKHGKKENAPQRIICLEIYRSLISGLDSVHVQYSGFITDLYSSLSLPYCGAWLIQTLNQNAEFIEATDLAVSNKKSLIHVLHVDDDPSVLEITKLMLLELDGSFEIDHACCVDEALKKLAT